MEQFVLCQAIWNDLFYSVSMKNKFAERFYELRKEKNLSRAEIGTILNVSTRLISYWENDERQCDFDMLIKIANCFSVSIDYLLGKTDY